MRDTATEDSDVDIVGNGQGIEFVHLQPRVSEGIEVTVHLMLQHLLQRGEGLPVTQMDRPDTDRSEVPSRGVDLWIRGGEWHRRSQTEGHPDL